MRQIVVNLLSNAVKYSPTGSSINFDLSFDSNFVIIQITDHGIGILEQDQPHLFEMFYRGKNARKIRGSGLGLAIVQNAVLMHRGTVDFQSQVQKGTTFVVNLPLERAT